MDTLKFIKFSACVALTFSAPVVIQAMDRFSEDEPAQSGSPPSIDEGSERMQTSAVAADFFSLSATKQIEKQQTKQEGDQKQESPEAGRKEEAVRYYHSALKHHYRQGPGQDYTQAIEQLEESAAQADASAQYALGTLYRNGQGVPQDYGQAKAWYEKSAMQGNADAQYMLGVLYHYGEGVPSDFVQAREWYEKAATQGNVYAINGLANIPKGYVRARERREKAASQGGKLANTPSKNSEVQKPKKEGRRGWFSGS
jgi:TPR repeat protein